MQHFPHELISQFTPQGVLRQWSSARGGVWKVLRITDGKPCVIKTMPSHQQVNSDALQRIHAIKQSAGLSITEEHGTIGKWYYELSAFCNYGTLDSAYKSLPFSQWGETALVQLIEGLNTLHEQNIVHSDLKLANILIHQEATGDLQFRIADFEEACLLAMGSFSPTKQRLTVSYAAPEVVGSGTFFTASDYWSLGILLLTWQIGARPFAGLNDKEVRILLSTGWKPDFDAISDQNWRALIAGLLECSPDTRWGIEECSQWLRHDPSIISTGLILSGISAATTPLRIGSHTIFTAPALAGTLLTEWNVAFFESKSELNIQLLTWLREELQREDMAERLEQIMQHSQSSDIRLLQYSHALWSDMPAIWRGIELTAVNLDATAHAAIQDKNRLTWLQSLLESTCFELYERWEHHEVGEIGRKIQQFQQDYTEAWDMIISQGAPEQARLTDEQALPLLVRLACSEEQQKALYENVSQQLLNPSLLLRRASWYLTFGTDTISMSAAQMLILQQMDRASLLSTHQVNALDEMGELDEAALREGIVQLKWYDALMNTLVVPEGSTVHVLQPGDIHRPHGITNLKESIADFWYNSIMNLRRIWRKHAQTESAATENMSQAIMESEPWLQVRMVSVRESDVPYTEKSFVEGYCAQLTWRIPNGWYGGLRITHPGALITHYRLHVPLLPQQGHLLLLLTDNCNIQLVCKRRWWQLSKHLTAPLRIYFSPKAAMATTHLVLQKAEHQLTTIKHLFTSRAKKLAPVSTRLIGIQQNLLASNTSFISPDYTMRKPSKMISVRQANRKEKIIGGAFVQHMEDKQTKHYHRNQGWDGFDKIISKMKHHKKLSDGVRNEYNKP